jgi:DNA-binding transcriptional regulator of glucitol operon
MPSPAPRWRFLITPRWLGWHAFTVLAVAGMLALGYWQLRRAEQGNSLSWAYTFEWPVFAVFGVVFWAKTIRDEFAPPDAGEAPDKAAFAVGADGTRLPGGPGPAAAEEDEPEDADLAAYNAYLARLQDQVKGHGRWHGLR